MVKKSFADAGTAVPASPDNVGQYIEQIIKFVEAYSIQPAADRERFASSLREETARATSFAETFPLINRALRNLGDNHSQLTEPGPWQDFMQEQQPLPTGKIINGMAYINMPSFNINEVTSASDYVAHCHQLIEKLDSGNPKGWVLDVRGNGGGSSWPMIAGMGPLFEEKEMRNDGLLGYFLTRDGRQRWGYKDGQSWGDTEAHEARWENAGTTSPYHLKVQEPRVAVLMGKITASAAETVCVAALGLKPRVKIFGSDSSGMASGNSAIPDLICPDAMIFIATSQYADRNGQALERTLKPDVYVAESNPGDTIPPEAFQWINELKPVHTITAPKAFHQGPS